MLHRFNDLALRYKFAALAGIPLAALLVLGAVDLLKLRAFHTTTERFGELVELSVVASRLVHELQKERGSSAGFLGSGGTRFRDVVDAQRKLTDERLRAYRNTVENTTAGAAVSTVGVHLSRLDGALGEIGSLRSEVDALAIEVSDQVARYTALNTALLDISGSLARHAPDGSLANAGTPFATLLQSKERAGLERALLSNAFARDAITPAMFDRFNKLVSEQKVYIEMFHDAANERQKAFFAERMRDPAVAEVERMRAVLVERSALGGFGIDPVVAFDAATRKIGLLTEIEGMLAEDLGELAVTTLEASERRLLMLALPIVATVILSLLTAVLIGRGILGSVRSAVTLAETLSRGDLTQPYPGEPHRDETGHLLRALDATRTRLLEVIESAQTVAESVREGSGEIRAGHTSLSSRTEEQAAGLEETSSSAQEIAVATKNNAESAERVDRLAGEARQRAVAGQRVVGEAVEAMTEISSASERIADIIGVIDEIAFQTNLLALNAAVEAARAGEQGRGFAVVASEVRQLAGRSAEAAREIKDLIEDSGSKVESGAGFVDRSGQTLEELVGVISEVSELISGIASASREQTIGIDRIHGALDRIDGVTQRNAVLVEESATASERMDREAGELAERLRFFKVRAAPA